MFLNTGALQSVQVAIVPLICGVAGTSCQDDRSDAGGSPYAQALEEARQLDCDRCNGQQKGCLPYVEWYSARLSHVSQHTDEPDAARTMVALDDQNQKNGWLMEDCACDL